MKIKIKMHDKILIDSSEVENDFVDIDFLIKKEILTLQSNGKLKVNFVGEVITPNCKIISLPKNFDITQSNIELTLNVLKTFRSLKKDGKTLIENKSFTASGEITSDVQYFKLFKKFFFDHITYDFITPKKKLNKHTSVPMAASFDVVQTEINIERLGGGLTYKLKDKSNLNWKSNSLSNIYYSTCKDLLNEFGTESDKQEFISVENYYVSKGHKFDYINIDEEIVLNEIIKNDVGDVHLPIKSTLINYYKNKSVNEKYKIRIFYSKNFEYVWEYFCRVALKHNEKFKRKIEWVESNYKSSNPDVFSDFEDKMFIADCKYYNDLNSDYTKEMYEYNECQNNQYPVIILVPSDDTTIVSEPRRHKEIELIIAKISLREVIKDVVENTDCVINKIYDIISTNSIRNLSI